MSVMRNSIWRCLGATGKDAATASCEAAMQTLTRPSQTRAERDINAAAHVARNILIRMTRHGGYTARPSQHSRRTPCMNRASSWIYSKVALEKCNEPVMRNAEVLP